MMSRRGFSRLDLSDLYRVSVEPVDWRGSLRMMFIRASSQADAHLMVAGITAILEHRPLGDAESRVYNVKSAQRLIDEGLNADSELRIFEVGWRGLAFVRQPIFLLSEPAVLTRRWAQVLRPDGSSEGAP